MHEVDFFERKSFGWLKISANHINIFLWYDFKALQLQFQGHMQKFSTVDVKKS